MTADRPATQTIGGKAKLSVRRRGFAEFSTERTVPSQLGDLAENRQTVADRSNEEDPRSE